MTARPMRPMSALRVVSILLMIEVREGHGGGVAAPVADHTEQRAKAALCDDVGTFSCGGRWKEGRGVWREVRHTAGSRWTFCFDREGVERDGDDEMRDGDERRVKKDVDCSWGLLRGRRLLGRGRGGRRGARGCWGMMSGHFRVEGPVQRGS